MTNFLKVAGPTIFSCINKYRLLTSVTSFKYQRNWQIKITDTVILRIKGRHQSVWSYIALAPRDVHCVRCVTAVFPPIKTLFLLNLVITNVPARQQEINPAVWVSGRRHSIDRWVKETLDAVAGLEINSEPHCNRRLGGHCSYLRGIWHLSHSLFFCLSFLFLSLFLFLSTFTIGFLILHSHVWCSTNVISTYSWPGSDGLIFNSCMVTFVVRVGWHSRFSSPQQPAHLTRGTQEGL